MIAADVKPGDVVRLVGTGNLLREGRAAEVVALGVAPAGVPPEQPAPAGEPGGGGADAGGAGGVPAGDAPDDRRDAGPAPLTDAADFDADTPPPRTRPKGDPVPRYVSLPPGVSPLAEFYGWDKAGRVPAGCVLCKFVGSDFGTRPPYLVAAYPPGGAEPLGRLGGGVDEAELAGYAEAVQVHTQRPRETWTVFAPKVPTR